MKKIAIIATLDTKGAEVAFAKGLIEQWGHQAILIDIGVGGSPQITPEITSQEVLGSCGLSWEEIVRCEKGKRIELMGDAVAAMVVALHKNKAFDAIFAMGGVQNTLMGANAMKMLPVGVPKLILSTMASGKRLFGPFVGARDIAIMHSVADISGINLVTRNVISTALAAIVGMAVNGPGAIGRPAHPVVGATMLGVTGGGVTAAARMMQKAGYETVTFHATGVGGPAMEDFIRQGVITATLDMTLHEISDEVIGGYCAGAKYRLMAAAEAGIPQVLVPGAVDMISCCMDFGLESFPADWQSRKHISHNSNLFHVKVHVEEIIRVSAVIAERLNQCTGPVTVLLPLRGFCEAGAPGKALYDPEVDHAFVMDLKGRLNKNIKWLEADLNISQPEFGELAAKELLNYLE